MLFLQSSLFHVGISNAVLATGLAMLVFLVTWKSKWPAWSHALWVLVLVKLIAPPIFWVNAELPASVSRVVAVAEVAPTFPDADRHDLIGKSTGIQIDAVTTIDLQSASTAPANRVPWQSIVLIVWLVGTICVFAVTIFRWTQFRRWLKRADPAPKQFVGFASEVVQKVGVKRVPKVWLVRGVIAPSVFSLGRRANLILPVELLNQLSESELQTVIAHELIHLRRGDHWVRLLEVVVGGLFWWHPVVPLARRKIHLAADESCDAGVTSRLPDAARDYASAMLKTVDFLSGVDAKEKQSTMPLMIAIGDSRSLARRMRQISQSTESPTSTWRGRVAIAVATLLLLPLAMLTLAPKTEAQQPPNQQPPAQQPKPAGISDPFGADPFGGEAKSKPPKPTDSRLLDPRTIAQQKIDAEAHLWKSLNDEVSFAAVELPLAEAIQKLSRQTRLPMLVDNRSLEEIGLTPDVPVTINLQNVSLRSMLRLMLRKLDLTYMVKDQVIQITTMEVADRNLSLKTYTLPVELADRSEKVLAALKTNVKPDTWEVSGGPSTASTIDNVLVVSANEIVHVQVEAFLLKVEAAFKVYQKKAAK